VPQRGDKKTLQETVARNAAQSLALHKTKRASDLTTRNRALEEIQQALDLDEVPLRIECYDVSNLQGTEVVASMVVFEDGLPRKSEYRRFVIRGVDGQNDVASMHETITRRFRRMLDEQGATRRAEARVAEGADADEGPLLVDPDTGRPRKFAYAPGLVVVDGGPPQVTAAQQALTELGIVDIPVCGLAKRLEEVWLPDQEDPVVLPRSSEGLYLLQRVRDEAHRFAIDHHRGRRDRGMLAGSVLDSLPGVGPARKRALLQHFGTPERFLAATREELEAVPGLPGKVGREIHEQLNRTN
jgi:excinuclease ABC subunit C